MLCCFSTLRHEPDLTVPQPACARLYGYIYPARNAELLKLLQAHKLTVIGEHLPFTPGAVLCYLKPRTFYCTVLRSTVLSSAALCRL